MNIPRLIGRTGTLVCVAVAAQFGLSPSASAAITEFSQTQTLANGALVCGGNIRAWGETNSNWPDKAILNMQATPMVGVGGTGSSAFAPVCNVFTTLTWRNLDTGATGQMTQNVVAGMYGSILYALYQPTGRGRIVVDVTTNMPNIPGHGEFIVP